MQEGCDFTYFSFVRSPVQMKTIILGYKAPESKTANTRARKTRFIGGPLRAKEDLLAARHKPRLFVVPR